MSVEEFERQIAYLETRINPSFKNIMAVLQARVMLEMLKLLRKQNGC